MTQYRNVRSESPLQASCEELGREYFEDPNELTYTAVDYDAFSCGDEIEESLQTVPVPYIHELPAAGVPSLKLTSS